MSFSIRCSVVLLCIFASLSYPVRLHAQADALATVRQSLTASPAPYRILIDGIFAGKDMLGQSSEIRIVNGAVSLSFLQAHNNQNVPVPQGTLVRIMKVATQENPKNDILRVTVSARGIAIPLAFVLAKGALTSMSGSQLQELIGQVLSPVQQQQAPSPTVVTSSNAPQPPASSAPAAPAPDVPQPLDSPVVTELATILNGHQGQAIVKPENVRAAMASPNNTADNMIVDGVFHPQPRGGRNGMRDMYLWPNTQVQFISLNAYTDENHDLLRLVVRAPIGAFAPLTWEFPKGQLATMSKAQIMHAVDPFVVFAAADENTFRNEAHTSHAKTSKAAPSSSSVSSSSAIVASCPARPGKDVGFADVKVNGKRLEETDGDDNGMEWTLPDVRQCAVLLCGYIRKGTNPNPSSIPPSAWLPVAIPASGKTCTVLNGTTATCSK